MVFTQETLYQIQPEFKLNRTTLSLFVIHMYNVNFKCQVITPINRILVVDINPLTYSFHFHKKCLKIKTTLCVLGEAKSLFLTSILWVLCQTN